MDREASGVSLGTDLTGLGHNGVALARGGGYAEMESFLGWGTVKGARGRRAPYGGCAGSWRQDAGAGRSAPRHKARTVAWWLQEVEGVHVDEDVGVGNLFGVGVR